MAFQGAPRASRLRSRWFEREQRNNIAKRRRHRALSRWRQQATRRFAGQLATSPPQHNLHETASASFRSLWAGLSANSAFSRFGFLCCRYTDISREGLRYAIEKLDATKRNSMLAYEPKSSSASAGDPTSSTTELTCWLRTLNQVSGFVSDVSGDLCF